MLLIESSQQVKMKKLYWVFNYTLHHYYDKSKILFDEFLINYLINDLSLLRRVALNIIQSLTNNKYLFDYDIASLKPIEQYKLWVTLLQRYNDPQISIPPLLPLLKSGSVFICEVFICKLEEYAINFGESLFRTLRKIFRSL